MKQSGKRPYPWGLGVTLACLAVLVVVLLRTFSGADRSPSSISEAAAVLAAGSAFLIGRWLLHSCWGLINAVVLVCHPLFFHWAMNEPRPLLAEALELVILATTLGGWLLIDRPSGSVLWVVLGGLLILCTAWLWGIQPTNGLMTSLLIILGFFAAFIWGVCRRHKTGSSWANWVAALLIALAVPPTSLGVAYGIWNDKFNIIGFPPVVASPENLWVFLEAAIDPDFASQELHGLAPTEMERWAWPVVWVIVPLMVWGLWRSLRRGWKQCGQGQTPLPWSLTLFAVLDIAGVALHPASARATFFLPLAALAVLLSVFCIADLLRGMGERLVLQPEVASDE